MEIGRINSVSTQKHKEVAKIAEYSLRGSLYRSTSSPLLPLRSSRLLCAFALKPRAATRQYAFTLIEILVVLIIVAIIMAVALMAFGDFGKSRKQHIAALQLQQSMLAAQSQAILQPAVLGLTFTSKGYHYYRYWVDPKTNQPLWINLHDDVLSQPYAFETATEIKVNNIKNTKHNPKIKGVQPLIYFLPNGTVTKFNVMIHFANKQRFTISSNGAGGINFEEK